MLSESAEDRALDALVELIKSASTPELLEAQTILARRLALQGDVVNARVPAPRNISEIGGYINLLAELNQSEMRAQVLAGILGVAGPNQPLGWLSSGPPLAMVPLINDRPECDAQVSIPLSITVRSDFVAFLKLALQTIHDQGATLPLSTPPIGLPVAAPGYTPPSDMLPFLGRVLDVFPGAALHAPGTDPVALARPQGSTDPFRVVALMLVPGTVHVVAANWDVMQCDSTACTPVVVNDASYVEVVSPLATAGFYPPSPLPEPTSLSSVGWARFVNKTGLVVGATRLGDDLAMLHSTAEISGSALVGMLHWVWDGSGFSKP